jgi:hypothetical protein
MTALRIVLLASILCAACAGKADPGLMRTVDSLPLEPEKRSEQLASTQARPGPESRASLPPKVQRAEEAAAITAAIVGIMFSKSSNVTLFGLAPMDENLLFDRRYRHDNRRSTDDDGEDASDDGEAGDPDGAQLVPWITLPVNHE